MRKNFPDLWTRSPVVWSNCHCDKAVSGTSVTRHPCSLLRAAIQAGTSAVGMNCPSDASRERRTLAAIAVELRWIDVTDRLNGNTIHGFPDPSPGLHRIAHVARGRSTFSNDPSYKRWIERLPLKAQTPFPNDGQLEGGDAW